MIIGDQRRWWNREVPILRIGAVAGFAFIVFWTWVLLGDCIQNAAWSIDHQRTASFRGQTLHVPWLWREEEWTNYNEFNLTRSYVGTMWTTRVVVSYKNSAPADVLREVETRRENAAELSRRSIDFYERDDVIDPHFICMDSGFKSLPRLFIDCFSLDGRWDVSMRGLDRSRSDFRVILRGVGLMGKPSK
jgi:hypothetical protein